MATVPIESEFLSTSFNFVPQESTMKMVTSESVSELISSKMSIVHQSINKIRYEKGE
jgi:hypothetical protein